MSRYSYMATPEEEIKKTCHELCPDGYHIHVASQNEWEIIAEAVNQGIDSHLEGFTRSTFDSKTGDCLVHPDELHILLRRLGESVDPEANSLRIGILSTFDIWEV